jgi:hypothetical protein
VSPEIALNCLLPLTLSKNSEEFIKDSKRTKSGKIKEIKIPWLKKGNKKQKSLEYTLHGDMIIKDGKLTLNTNSVERAEQGKKLLKKLLGEAITFQKLSVESPDHKTKKKALPTYQQDNEDRDKLLEIPEIQEQLKAMAKAHWDSWFDTPIPLLTNKTPREAAKSREGQEQLEALLLQYERNDQGNPNNPFKADINFIKTTLKLKK